MQSAVPLVETRDGRGHVGDTPSTPRLWRPHLEAGQCVGGWSVLGEQTSVASWPRPQTWAPEIPNVSLGPCLGRVSRGTGDPWTLDPPHRGIRLLGGKDFQTSQVPLSSPGSLLEKLCPGMTRRVIAAERS